MSTHSEQSPNDRLPAAFGPDLQGLDARLVDTVFEASAGHLPGTRLAPRMAPGLATRSRRSVAGVIGRLAPSRLGMAASFGLALILGIVLLGETEAPVLAGTEWLDDVPEVSNMGYIWETDVVTFAGVITDLESIFAVQM